MKNKPGTLILRIPRDLKHRIEQIADEQGVSLNQLALYMFTKELYDFESSNYFEKYWKHKSKKELYLDFDLVMNKIKDEEVPDWDKL